MSEGLESLNRIKMLEISCDRESYDLRPITKTHKEDLNTIEKELKRLEEIDESLNTGGGIWAENGIVSKKLKALEIIKNKGIHCGFVKRSDCLTYYNNNVPFSEQLTQEEFDLLREVLL